MSLCGSSVSLFDSLVLVFSGLSLFGHLLIAFASLMYSFGSFTSLLDHLWLFCVTSVSQLFGCLDLFLNFGFSFWIFTFTFGGYFVYLFGSLLPIFDSLMSLFKSFTYFLCHFVSLFRSLVCCFATWCF